MIKNYNSISYASKKQPNNVLLTKGVFGNALASSFPSEHLGVAPNTPTPRSQIREAERFARTNFGAPFFPICGATPNYREMPPPSENTSSLPPFISSRASRIEQSRSLSFLSRDAAECQIHRRPTTPAADAAVASGISATHELSRRAPTCGRTPLPHLQIEEQASC